MHLSAVRRALVNRWRVIMRTDAAMDAAATTLAIYFVLSVYSLKREGRKATSRVLTIKMGVVPS